LDPPLPVGDGLGGARDDTGRGAVVRPASPRWVGPINGTRRDPRTQGWDQQRAHHLGQVTITTGHGDFHLPSRPGHATHPGHSPTPEVYSGGLNGGWPHFGAPARSTGLRRQSVGLILGCPLCPWLRVVRPIIFLFLLSFVPRSNCNIHFHTHTHTHIYRIFGNMFCYTLEPLCLQ
jgi:hypothetical protein